ncbi:MAG: hypothetical protein FWE47_00470 [Oscillospiraceae bacterium]|nr:hypothetical protein [Oscillospiraceae bacterium]
MQKQLREFFYRNLFEEQKMMSLLKNIFATTAGFNTPPRSKGTLRSYVARVQGWRYTMRIFAENSIAVATTVGVLVPWGIDTRHFSIFVNNL